LGYTVLRHREFGTVVELFHDSDDGFFRVLPGHATPRERETVEREEGERGERGGRGELRWNGEFTRPIFMCARWGDFWERRSFNAHMLVKHVTERSGQPSVAFPRHGVAAGLFTIQVQGPLLRLTWALDCHRSVKCPALTFLTPEGIIHFGYQALVQVSQGHDPHRLPRYTLEAPRELLLQGRSLFRRELRARLNWYSNGGADFLLLPRPAADYDECPPRVALGECAGGQVAGVDTTAQGQQGLDAGTGEEDGDDKGKGGSWSDNRAVCARLREGREKPDAPRRRFRPEVDHLGAVPFDIA